MKKNDKEKKIRLQINVLSSHSNPSDMLLNILGSGIKSFTVITLLTGALLLSIPKDKAQEFLFTDVNKEILFHTSDSLPITQDAIEARIKEINSTKFSNKDIVALINNENSNKTPKKEKLSNNHSKLVEDWNVLNQYETAAQTKINSLDILEKEADNTQSMIDFTKSVLNDYSIREDVKRNEASADKKSIGFKMFQKPKGIIHYQGNILCSYTTFSILEATKDYDRTIAIIASKYDANTQDEYKMNPKDILFNKIYVSEVIIYNIEHLKNLDKELSMLENRLTQLKELSQLQNTH